MGRKYLNVARGKQTYRMFLEDIQEAYKKIKRVVPKVPKYRHNQVEDDTDIDVDNRTQIKAEEL